MLRAWTESIFESCLTSINGKRTLTKAEANKRKTL